MSKVLFFNYFVDYEIDLNIQTSQSDINLLAMACENSTQTITLLVVGVQLSLLIYLLNIA